MREQIQISLRIAAVFFLLWALALASDPMVSHKLISTGPLDTVTHAMLAGLFLGLAILLLLESNDPRDDITGAMALIMLILAVVAAVSMAGSRAMPANVYTVASLVFVTGMGAYLLIGQMQEMFASGGGVKRAKPRRAPTKRKPAKKAKKKAAKKKVTKKAKKKAKKKKRR